MCLAVWLDGVTGSDANDGSSPSSALATLAGAALASARFAQGACLYVAPAIYSGLPSESISFTTSGTLYIAYVLSLSLSLRLFERVAHAHNLCLPTAAPIARRTRSSIVAEPDMHFHSLAAPLSSST